MTKVKKGSTHKHMKNKNKWPKISHLIRPTIEQGLELINNK